MKTPNPLSLVEVGYSPRSVGIAKRLIRIAWVLVVNGFVAWLMFTRLRSVGFPTPDFQADFELAFEVSFPIAGIVLEAGNWKLAKLVNVGGFLAAGIYWMAAAAWDHSDPFFGVLLIIGLGLLTVAGLTEVIYRSTTNRSSEAA